MNTNEPARHSRRASGCATLALALVFAGATGSANADGLTWTVAPYLWASDVGLDLAVNDEDLLGGTAEFSDLVDKLDTALMAHIEASGERFGGYLDLIYIDLSDDRTINLGPGAGDPNLGDLAVDANLGMEIYELGAFYRFPLNDAATRHVDIVMGLRDVSADVTVDIESEGPSDIEGRTRINNGETDFLAGVRFIGKFGDSKRWGYKLRADYGFGGSEGSVNALATVGYTFGESGLFTLDAGYRHFNVEFSKNFEGPVRTTTEITMSGPLLGFIFQF